MNFEVDSTEYIQHSSLKSKRQKNWLSTPGSTKRVTFQKKLKTPSRLGLNLSLTKVKSDKLDRTNKVP